MADRLSRPSFDLDCHSSIRSINQSPLKPINSSSEIANKDNESCSDSLHQTQDQLSPTRLSVATVASSSLQAPSSLSTSIPSSSPSSSSAILNQTSLSLRTQPSSKSSLSSANPSHHLKRSSKKNRSSGSISLGISNLIGPFRSSSNITAATTDPSTSNTEINHHSLTDQNKPLTLQPLQIAQSSSSATASPAASSQSRPLASASHSVSSHPPVKPKRDFLGLDLHLSPRLSSSQASKSGPSFLASLSSINNKSHKSSSSSNSPRPSTASSTLSGTPRLRNSHHRLSFQPPTKLSPPQPLHPIGRSFAKPGSSPQGLVKSIPPKGDKTCIDPAGPSSSVKTFDHPFASPPKPPRLPTSISAPHISSLLPHSSSLARLQPTTDPAVHRQLTSPTKPLSKSESNADNLNFSFQPTEPISSTPKPDRSTLNPIAHSLNSKMRAMFGRKPSVTSTTSSSTASSNHRTISPPVSHPPAQHPKFEKSKPEPTAVFVHDQDDGENCPVCLEDLKLRLQGEKPHVIPSCGHILHASCFEAVYGNIVEAKKTGQILGLCGVCRKDMRLGDLVSGGPASRNVPSMAGRLAGGHSPSGTISAGPDATVGKNIRNKFAAMAGLQASPAKAKGNSVNRKTTAATPAVPYHDSAADKEEALDPDEDDALLNPDDSLSRSRGSSLSSSQQQKTTKIIQPNIYAISELGSLFQQQDARQTQHLTCMVSIEIPSRNPAPFPPTPNSATYSSQASPLYHPSQAGPLSSSGSAFSYPSLASVASPSESEHSAHNRMANPRHKVFPKVKSSPNLATTSLPEKPISEPVVTRNPLQLLVDDLLNRLHDWKGHSLTDFGALKLHDRIQVRKQSHSRDFLVYLFEEALLCVHEEKPSRPLSTSGSNTSSKLRLKGRIYIRHMTAVVDSSSTVPLTLTIQMQDDNMDVFVMRFNDAAQLESWKATIQLLIDKHFPDRARLEGRMPLPPVPSPTTDTTTSPILATSEEPYEVLPETATSSEGGYASSSYTAYTKTTNLTSAPTLYSVGEEDDGNGSQSYPAPRRQRRSIAHSVSYRHATHDNEPRHLPRAQSPSYPTYHTIMTDNPFNNLEEISPIDLMLMISITTSSPNNMPTSSNMKSRLIKETLEFIIRHLHPRSRLSLIIYSVGSDQKSAGNEKGEAKPQESQLKKTPFLCVGKESSRRRLEFVIEQIARGGQSSGILNPKNERYYSEFEPFYRRSQRSQTGHYGETAEPPPIDYEMLEGSLKMIEMAEERVSVATGMNLAYDIILQRKQKNPLSGFLLLHDQRDTTTKPQMALVMTRAEAANVPVHTIGWGKVHSPSCLWQLSNHTGGTYTYVNDLYEIKDTLTGCIGGMISVGATNAKLQISVPEHRWFKMKKVTGVTTFVLSANGQHADIDLGEMRYGERREILVEVEMRDAAAGFDSSSEGGGPNSRGLTGTDAFFMNSVGGLKEIGRDGGLEQDFYQAEFDQLSDDVPLLEVDASYRDPIAGKTVSRLVRPVLLSITITPPQPLANPRVSTGNEPSIVRRRIELLTSDSLTRALVLVARRMERQASRLLEETRHIVHTLLGNLHNGSERPRAGSLKGKKAIEQSTMREVLTGCLEDIETVLVVIEDLVRIIEDEDEDETNLARHQFDSNERNLAAQQAIVLKNQSAWTGRTLTEKSFWKADRSMMFYLKCLHST